MTNYEISSFPNINYLKIGSDYINMHEVHVHYNHLYNIYLVIGFIDNSNDIYYAMIQWRNEWHGNRHPIVHTIVKNTINVVATNNSGTVAFNTNDINFIVMPIMY